MRMTTSRIAAALITAAFALPALAACTPAPPPPTPLPTALPTVTQPPTEDEMKAAAIEGYWKAYNATLQVDRAGGSPNTPQSFKNTMSGESLEAATRSAKYLYDEGIRAEGEPTKPRVFAGDVKRQDSRGPAEVKLTACQDNTNVYAVNKDGKRVEKVRVDKDGKRTGTLKQDLRVVSIVMKLDKNGVWKRDKVNAKLVDSFDNQGVCDDRQR